MGILNRIKGMMVNPAAEWDAVARDMPGAGVLLRNFLLPLSLLAPAATIVGLVAFNTGWNATYGYSMARDRILVIALTTFVFEIASVYVLAAVLYLLARTESVSPGFLVTLRVAVFGSIPVLISGATLVIPFSVVFTIVAMMYSFYLYYLGAERLIGIRPADSAMFIGVAMICMLVLSGFIGAIASALGIA